LPCEGESGLMTSTTILHVYGLVENAFLASLSRICSGPLCPINDEGRADSSLFPRMSDTVKEREFGIPQFATSSTQGIE